jgi:hypothetical protein
VLNGTLLDEAILDKAVLNDTVVRGTKLKARQFFSVALGKVEVRAVEPIQAN